MYWGLQGSDFERLKTFWHWVLYFFYLYLVLLKEENISTAIVQSMSSMRIRIRKQFAWNKTLNNNVCSWSVLSQFIYCLYYNNYLNILYDSLYLLETIWVKWRLLLDLTCHISIYVYYAAWLSIQKKWF